MASEVTQAGRPRQQIPVHRILEAITDSVVALDGELRYTYVNEHAALQLGHSASELVGRSLPEMFPPGASALVARMRKALASHQAERFEYRTSQGRDLDVRIYPDADGLVIMFSDVSEQHRMLERVKRSEQELRNSEARLAMAQAISGIGTWELDEATRVTFVSSNVPAMYGLRGDRPFTFDQWMDLAPRHVRDDVVSAVALAFTGEDFDEEIEFRRPDGTRLITKIHAELVIDPDGRRKLVGTVRDITARVIRDEALRASEERLSLIFNSASDAMFLLRVVKDDHYVIEAVNESFLRLTGFVRHHVVGRDARQVIPPSMAKAAFERYARAVANRVAIDYVEEVSFHGEPVTTETRLTPVFDALGRVTHLLGVARDISERRRLELRRQEMEAELQHAQKLESLGVLAGGLAHDFNNLLVGILGNASLALLDLEPATEVAAAVSDIERTARQASELTNQLLAYSGKGRFVVAPVDLGRLVEDMSPVWRSALSKRAKVTLALSDGLPPVEGDVAQLKQVVLNMMTNASDALGDAEGEITVRTGTVQLDREALAAARFASSAEPGEFAFVEVEDTGVGMDADTLGRIFDPFFSTKFTGRGLGLAATLGIVRGHRGAIIVRSEPGRGTRFRVAFPARADLVTPAPADPRDSLHAGSGTVLVVDDEAAVRVAVRRILTRAGYTVLEASDGREGIDVFREHRDQVHCVVVDLTMPALGGADVVRALRELRPDVQVVIASGYDAESVTGLDRHAHVFLHKPFSAAELVAAVSRHGS